MLYKSTFTYLFTHFLPSPAERCIRNGISVVVGVNGRSLGLGNVSGGNYIGSFCLNQTVVTEANLAVGLFDKLVTTRQSFPFLKISQKYF